MSTSKRKAPDGPRTSTAAQAAEREDPMTSFDPEADRAGQPSDAASPAAPAERRPRGNGSVKTAREPGEAAAQPVPAAPEGKPAAPAPPGPGAAAQPGPGPAGAAPEPPAAGPSELELARQEAAANYDRLLRLQAEFENTKRRVAKEHADSLRYALTPLVTELAPIMDHLEKALEHARSEPGESVAALVAGIEMVAKQMREAFGRFGVTRIEAVGKPFDPAQHEAIAVVERDNVADNHVLEEFQAGYLLHDRVIRPARVSVSRRIGDAGQKSPPNPN